MATGFSEKLSGLRRERGLNQRTAAARLKISQALLSHYENGIREPGLDFVCRACEFYGVSADYLLGRTELRRAAPSAGTAAERQAADAALALLDALCAQGTQRAAPALEYLGCAQYRLLRLLYSGEELFSVAPAQAEPLCRIVEAELQFKLSQQTAPPTQEELTALSAFAAQVEERLLAVKKSLTAGE